MMRIHFLALIAGFFTDFIFGDPAWFPHPVRFIGHFISFLEKILRNEKKDSNRTSFIKGIILSLLVILTSILLPFVLLFIFYQFNKWAGFIIESFLCYTLCAAKSLKDESMKVYDALMENDIDKARYYVSRIVGRDTKSLSKEGIIKATVETIAENTSDGEIAPLFYAIFLGPVFSYGYKAVNTLDSMIGYKNEKYLYFGRFAAKLDDLLNYIPARLSAILMIIATFITNDDKKGAYTIWRRDSRNHASPNSAQTESVCAGAFGIMLAGDAWYFGQLYHKPTIGDNKRTVETNDIKKANKLLYVSSFLMLILIIIIYVVRWKLYEKR